MGDKEQAALKKKLEALLKLPHNLSCADCPSRLPRWASTNLGVFICTNCSGIHRGLGVHISKVRSCALDKWTPELVSAMENIGNARANAFWERNVPATTVRPREGDMKALDRWIRDKYELGHFKDRNCAPPDGKAAPAPAAAAPPVPPKPGTPGQLKPVGAFAAPLLSPAAIKLPTAAAPPRPPPAPVTADLLGALDAPSAVAPPAAPPAWDAFAAPAAAPAAAAVLAAPKDDWMASFAAPPAAPPAAPAWDAFASATPPQPPQKSTAAILDLFGPAPTLPPPPQTHAFGAAAPGGFGAFGMPPPPPHAAAQHYAAAHTQHATSGQQLPGLLAGMHVSGAGTPAAAAPPAAAPPSKLTLPVMGAGADFSL